MKHLTKTVWVHWQNLNEDNGKPWWRNSRAWLHTPWNTYGVVWSIWCRHFGAEITFADKTTGDDSLMIFLGVGLFAVWFHVENLQIVRHLPGVKWREGHHDDGRRELGFALYDGGIWFDLWSNDGDKYRVKCFRPADVLLGRHKYSERVIQSGETAVQMPEGAYLAAYKLYHAYWKRPCWPWATHIRRGEIEVEDGVPVPGKGENSWDIDDDAIYSLTTPAKDVPDLVGELVASVLRTRMKYGGADWRPAQRDAERHQ